MSCVLHAEINTAQDSSENTPQNVFHDNWGEAPLAGSFRMKDYIVWGGSVIKGKKDGRYYMFAARWPKLKGKSNQMSMGNWVTHSEIVLASSDKAMGPYKFEKVVLPSRGAEFWDGQVTHNPNIHYHQGKYILFYTGTTYDFEKPKGYRDRKKEYEPAWNHKRIGVAVADSPQGPWKRLDHPILTPRPGKWDAAITSNAAAVIHEDGSVVLIYKSAPVTYPGRHKNKALSFGLATAKNCLGPYTRANNGDNEVEIKGLTTHVEDPYIWFADGYYKMLAKSMDTRGGFFAYSKDAFHWNLAKEHNAYGKKVMFEGLKKPRHQIKLERPQVLIQDGKPTHVFFATADKDWADVYNLVMPLKGVK